MASISRTIIPLAAALLASAALTACDKEQGAAAGNGTASAANSQAAPAHQLFSTDFKGVCSGASVSSATPYEPAAKAHKALYFATYEDDFIDRSSSLPDDWTIQWSPSGDALKGIDLVVCARRTADRQVKVCDGYKHDGRETQNKVRWHTATYQLSVVEALTGRKLAEKSVEATDTDCPMLVSFEGDSDIVDDYASPSDSAIADFLRPHITE